MHLALVCLKKLEPKKFYEEFPNDRPQRDGKYIEIKETELEPTPGQIVHFTTVKAHRFYQFAMCYYKIWRYKEGGDLLDGVREVEELRKSNTVHPLATDKLLPKNDKKVTKELTMTSDVEWWAFVDNCLIKAIQNYKEITMEINGHRQPVFIDLIIKLTIARSYANK